MITNARARSARDPRIAAYTTARNLAMQMQNPDLVQLLTLSLGDEQNASQLLDQVAQPLLSLARMPAAVE
jgi:Mn-containing catalase